MGSYAAKMAYKKIVCQECSQSLGSKEHIAESKLIRHLDRGGLFKPTTSVVKVCTEAEKAITQMLLTTNGKLPQGKGIPDAIALSVLWALGNSQIFQELALHCTEFPLDEEYHIYALIKEIVKCYCKIRFHRLAKVDTAQAQGQNMRSRLHNQILFNGH